MAPREILKETNETLKENKEILKDIYEFFTTSSSKLPQTYEHLNKATKKQGTHQKRTRWNTHNSGNVPSSLSHRAQGRNIPFRGTPHFDMACGNLLGLPPSSFADDPSRLLQEHFYEYFAMNIWNYQLCYVYGRDSLALLARSCIALLACAPADLHKPMSRLALCRVFPSSQMIHLSLYPSHMYISGKSYPVSHIFTNGKRDPVSLYMYIYIYILEQRRPWPFPIMFAAVCWAATLYVKHGATK